MELIIIFADKQNLKKITKYLNALHPNTKGYKIIADILYDYIIKNDLHTRVRLQSELYEEDWIDVLKERVRI